MSAHSKANWDAETRFGKVPDYIIAKTHNVSNAAVHYQRTLRGIKPHKLSHIRGPRKALHTLLNAIEQMKALQQDADPVMQHRLAIAQQALHDEIAIAARVVIDRSLPLRQQPEHVSASRV